MTSQIETQEQKQQNYRVALRLIKGETISLGPLVYTLDKAHEVVRNYGGELVEIWVEDADNNRIETEETK